MKRTFLVIASLAAGCTTTSSPTGSVSLGEPGRLALAGDCIVVAEHASLVCAPRAGGGTPHTIATTPDRTYVAIVADDNDDGVLATSIANNAVELDHVGLDGTVTPLASAAASDGAGELALADKQIVLSTGALLVTVDAQAGGVTGLVATATETLGSVAVRGTTVYYVDDTTLDAVDLASPTGMPEIEAQSDTFAVAADADAAAYGTNLTNSSYSFVTNLTTREVTELHGTLSRVAIAGGHPYALVDGDVYDATGTDVETPLAGGLDAFDVAADTQAVYWITRSGDVGSLAR
ncbi:MAG TPA: hypothetical protein VMJ10_20180 [Kofleriaceae bacterium]|nr:hypothetical protein [Kofleriaceae bacterium]